MIKFLPEMFRRLLVLVLVFVASVANALDAGDVTTVVLIKLNGTQSVLPNYSTVFGNFNDKDLLAIASRMIYPTGSKCGVLILKKSADGAQFEPLSPNQQGFIDCLPFDEEYDVLKNSFINKSGLKECATVIAKSWASIKSNDLFFNHSTMIKALTYQSQDFRKAYEDIAIEQSISETNRYKRLCLGLVAFRTLGYAGFHVFLDDWTKVHELIDTVDHMGTSDGPDSLATYCAKEVFTHLAFKVNENNFNELWVAMQNQRGNLKAIFLKSLVVNPFLRSKSPLPRHLLEEKNRELLLMLTDKSDDIGFAAFQGLEVLKSKKEKFQENVDSLEKFKALKTQILKSFLK